MDGWQRINGVDWLCVEPVSGGDGSVEAGLIIGHGYAHESPADLGLGATAMTALVQELNRPRETDDLRVVELSAAAQVNLQDTILRLVGSPDAVRLGLIALDALLSDPSTVEIDELPDPPTYAWSGWTSELTAWFGMGTTAFAADYERPWSGDPERLRQLLGGLHPGRGAHVVGWASDQSLLGLAFSGVDRPSESTTPESAAANGPLRWRDPSPVADGPRSIVGTFGNNLLTVRLREDPVSSLALRLLARTAHRNLVEFTQLVNGLDLTVEQVGGESIFALRAVPNAEGFDAAKTGHALIEAVEAYAGLTDAALADELDRARQPEALNLDLAPGGRAVDAFRSARRPERDEIVGYYESVTVAELRRATDRIRERALFSVHRSDDPAPGRPIWQPTPLPEVGKPEWSRRSRVRLPMDGTEGTRPRISANTSVLDVTAPTGRNHGQGPKEIRTAVDLTALAVRVDQGSTSTTLIDREDRRATVVWRAYARTARLRALVDAASPEGARVPAPEAPALAAEVSRRLLRRRLGRGVLALVLVGLFALVFVPPLVTAIKDATTTYQQPVVTTVRSGQLITLANGTTALLSEPTWRLSTDTTSRFEVLSANVRYCGGGETVDQNTAADARNYVSPDRFAVTGIAAASRSINDLGSRRPALEATELKQGQCTSGEIAFSVAATSPVAGTRIHYRNGSGDDLTWTIG